MGSKMRLLAGGSERGLPDFSLRNLNSVRMFSMVLSISAYMDFSVTNSERIESGIDVNGCG